MENCKRIAESEWFGTTVLVLIIASSLLAGLETYPEFNSNTSLGAAIQVLQNVILACFVVEILIKIAGCGGRPWEYFKDPWNVFDFAIVAICLLPLDLHSMSVVRLARILRAMRMIAILPRLRVLVSALLRSIPSLGYIGVLLGLHFYVYAVMGTLAFSQNDPIRFGSLHVTATTLFQVLTLEGWNDVRDTQVLGSDIAYDDEWKRLAGERRQSQAMPVVAQCYFISFILVGTMIMLNLFTGVIIGSMEDAQQEVAAEKQSHSDTGNKGFLTLHDEMVMLGSQLTEINALVTKLQQKVAATSEQKVSV